MSNTSIKLISSFVLVIAMLGISCTNFAQSSDTKLTEVLKEKPFLVDVRTPQEFAEGSVEGAINIPLSEVESQLSQFEGKEKIVVFCKSGARSGNAKKILNKHGIDQVTNGGSWQNVKKAMKE